VSDVAGDVLDVLTDPTVADTSTAAEAISILEDYALWDHLPASIRSHLNSPKAESQPNSWLRASASAKRWSKKPRHADTER